MTLTEITETRQYLTFRLGDEVFATGVAKPREVPVLDLRPCFTRLDFINGIAKRDAIRTTDLAKPAAEVAA